MDYRIFDICAIGIVSMYFLKTFIPRLNGIGRIETKLDLIIKPITDLPIQIEKLTEQIRELKLR